MSETSTHSALSDLVYSSNNSVYADTPSLFSPIDFDALPNGVVRVSLPTADQKRPISSKERILCLKERFRMSQH
jgi:hypothetical protein